MIDDHPDIIALHLSRSIYDSYASRKNGAKVAFQETLHMGGILDRKEYRLLCVVIHKGGHESGHYECFRRQVVNRPPFSTPINSASAGTSTPTPKLTPTISGETLLGPSTPDPSMDMPRSVTPVSTPESEKLAKAFAKKEKKRLKLEGSRWWRISDDKIKEARTSDVLGMQKEVYLLFYQRVKRSSH